MASVSSNLVAQQQAMTAGADTLVIVGDEVKSIPSHSELPGGAKLVIGRAHALDLQRQDLSTPYPCANINTYDFDLRPTAKKTINFRLFLSRPPWYPRYQPGA